VFSYDLAKLNPPENPLTYNYKDCMARHFMSTKVGVVRTSGGGERCGKGGGPTMETPKDFMTYYFNVYPRTHANTRGMRDHVTHYAATS